MTREFWEQLLPAEGEALLEIGQRREFRRGAALFRESDRSNRVIVLRTGRVKVSVNTAGGTEVVLAVRGPGSLLGEFSAIDRSPHSATVTAIEPVTALAIRSPDFETYLHGNGRVAFLLMRTLAAKLRDADRKRIEFGAHDTTGRVAARLIELAERFGEPVEDGVRISLPFSQDELAGWIGSSREAVSKALGTLRGAGEIRTSRMSVVVVRPHGTAPPRQLALRRQVPGDRLRSVLVRIHAEICPGGQGAGRAVRGHRCPFRSHLSRRIRTGTWRKSGRARYPNGWSTPYRTATSSRLTCESARPLGE